MCRSLSGREQRERYSFYLYIKVLNSVCPYSFHLPPKFRIYILNFVWLLTLDDSIQAIAEGGGEAKEGLVQKKIKVLALEIPLNFRDSRIKKNQRRKQS